MSFDEILDVTAVFFFFSRGWLGRYLGYIPWEYSGIYPRVKVPQVYILEVLGNIPEGIHNNRVWYPGVAEHIQSTRLITPLLVFWKLSKRHTEYRAVRTFT